MRRVVVTGIGLVTPLGNSLDHFWQGLLSNACGIKQLTKEEYPDPSNYAKLGGRVLLPTNAMESLKLGKNKLNAMCFLATSAALVDAGLSDAQSHQNSQIGISIGSSKSQLSPIIHFLSRALEENYRLIPSEFYNHLNISTTSLNIINSQNFKGPSSSYSSGVASIAEGYNTIVEGDADVMVVGSADIGIHPYVFKALEKENLICRDAKKMVRPFDEESCGFAASDGAGVIVLEELKHAMRRGCSAYAEILRPAIRNSGIIFKPNKETARDAILEGLRRNGIKGEEVGVVCAYGAAGDYDIEESQVIADSIQRDCTIMSIKGNIGNAMTADSVFQAITSILAIKNESIPPIGNLHRPIKVSEANLDFVMNESRKKMINYSISNCFEFGGIQASLFFKKISLV